MPSQVVDFLSANLDAWEVGVDGEGTNVFLGDSMAHLGVFPLFWLHDGRGELWRDDPYDLFDEGDRHCSFVGDDGETVGRSCLI